MPFTHTTGPRPSASLGTPIRLEGLEKPEGKASSLGARLYAAMVDNAGRLDLTPPASQAYYERAAVRFVASLTYAESEGVREALLSSVLLGEIRKAEAFIAGFEGDAAQQGVDALLASMRAAITQAEEIA